MALDKAFGPKSLICSSSVPFGNMKSKIRLMRLNPLHAGKLVYHYQDMLLQQGLELLMEEDWKAVSPREALVVEILTCLTDLILHVDLRTEA